MGKGVDFFLNACTAVDCLLTFFLFFFFAVAGMGEITVSQAQEEFRLADADGNGYLDSTELVAVMEKLMCNWAELNWKGERGLFLWRECTHGSLFFLLWVTFLFTMDHFSFYYGSLFFLLLVHANLFCVVDFLF